MRSADNVLICVGEGDGDFIGIEDPSASEYQGRFFQLADVRG